MPRIVVRQKKSRKATASELFSRGSQLQEEGKLRSAFRLLLNAAKLGDSAAQLNLGYTYDVGLGVKRNRDAAMYWYRRVPSQWIWMERCKQHRNDLSG